MAKAGLQFSKKDEWYTPKAIVNLFGKFNYDPATTKEKAMEFGIANYDTITTNGLAADWTKYKRIWINPPFTLKNDFFKKAVDTYQKTKADIYILFPIEFITTQKFHNIIGQWGGVLYVPNGRIGFETNSNQKPTSPAFGSAILKIGDGPNITIKLIKIKGGKNEATKQKNW